MTKAWFVGTACCEATVHHHAAPLLINSLFLGLKTYFINIFCKHEKSEKAIVLHA